MPLGVPLGEVGSRSRRPTRALCGACATSPGPCGGAGREHVTLADKLPLMWHATLRWKWTRAFRREGKGFDGYRISTAAIDPDFFAVFDAAALAGRSFTPSDYAVRPRVVIVNQPFVDRVLGGRNPIGRRVRYVNVENSGDSRPAIKPDQPWLEIVGLVRDSGDGQLADRSKVAGSYLPWTQVGEHGLSRSES